MEWGERSKNAWEERADEWDQSSEEMWQQGPRGGMFDFFCEAAGNESLRVLDLGCGPGASTKRMLERGYQAVGVDQSGGMVEAARRRGVDAVESQCDPLPFADASFDAVFACTSLEWSTEPHKIIKEIRRVLKPGGQVIAVTLGAFARPRQSGFPRLYGEPVAHNMMMPWELHQLLADHRLKTVNMHGE